MIRCCYKIFSPQQLLNYVTLTKLLLSFILTTLIAALKGLEPVWSFMQRIK